MPFIQQRPFRGKKTLLFVGVILSLIFFISMLLTYLANIFITSKILPQINNNKSNLVLNVNIQLLPSIILSINNIEYKKKNKTIIQINQIAAHLSFWQLFHKKLHVSKLSISSGAINLYNIPAITLNKSTKRLGLKKRLKKNRQKFKRASQQLAKKSLFLN